MADFDATKNSTHAAAASAVPLAPSRPMMPELLAPAGNSECVRAAIENGADAIYFGLDTGFNARARAANFSLDTLDDLMAGMHRRGVKGYLTLNTLVFSKELAEAERIIRRASAAGVDALLVQDLGIVALIRHLAPDLPIHASTQMTMTSAETIRGIEALGIERVVLARELSIDEIREIRATTNMPLEAFVHGALCVAYSGQCLTSESLGGRSANRGQCAQACRLPYDLICDGGDIDLGAQKYLLSPQDLAGFELVPELIDAGVCSFKIEGRLKTPEYVANITRHYREAIDAAMAGRAARIGPNDIREMELSFSRGFSTGWLRGNDHKLLVPGLSSAKRGVLLGEVLDILEPGGFSTQDHRGARQFRDNNAAHRAPARRVVVRLSAPVARGDGVVFEGNRAENAELGGRIFGIFQKGRSIEGEIASGIVELEFGRERFQGDDLFPGQKIWKTDDPQLTARLRKSFSGPAPLRTLPLSLQVDAAVGEPFRVTARTPQGVTATSTSEAPLAEAIRHPLTEAMLREQFGRLGATAYHLGDLSAHISGSPMVPLSVLSKLRHELVRQLDEASGLPPTRRLAETVSHSELLRQVLNSMERDAVPSRGSEEAERSAPDDQTHTSSASQPTLHVLCRDLFQMETLLNAGVRHLYAEFQDIREYRDAVERSRAAGATLFLATPRIQKPGEMGIFHSMLKQCPDGILARNLSGLDYFIAEGLPVVADFSLNTANELTARMLRSRGVARITPSYDLNREQLLDLVGAVPSEWLEVVIHQHMPMFHMEHCVFCSVLSPGTNKTNCGRPCDDHVVQLRDRIGMEHPLKADVGCRNTLYNAVPQSGAEIVPDLRQRGVRSFRIELLAEQGNDVVSTLRIYQDLLANRIRGVDVWRSLKASNRVGVTRGTLEERRNPLAIL